jgi:hypothetical protein
MAVAEIQVDCDLDGRLRSSGINGATLVVDAGLGNNFFDKEIIRLAMRMDSTAS